jgi:hypothetical protein
MMRAASPDSRFLPPAAGPNVQAHSALADAVRGDALAAIVYRIELSPIRLRVILSAAALSCPTPEMLDLNEAMLIRDVPLRIKRRGVEMRLVIEGPSSAAANRDPTLLKEIRRAHRCFEALVSGRPAQARYSPGSATGINSGVWARALPRTSRRGLSLF